MSLIRIVTPEPPDSRRGNRVTAHRWEKMLVDQGHDVIVEQALSGEADLLIALHATKSRAAVAAFRGPAVVALTGTDLYGDLARGDRDAGASVKDAVRLIVLQPRAIDALEPQLRGKARVVYQSTETPAPAPERAPPFRVVVVGHMRAVKDPFRTAEAVGMVSEDSPVRVVHIGRPLDADTRDRVRTESRENPRYQWLGELSRPDTLVEIARSQLLCLTSVMEGGANVVTEALACGTPVVTSRIDGSLGLLGDDYPGMFEVGDTPALAKLLSRASTDGSFYAELSARCAALRHLAEPATERDALRALLAELSDF